MDNRSDSPILKKIKLEQKIEKPYRATTKDAMKWQIDQEAIQIDTTSKKRNFKNKI